MRVAVQPSRARPYAPYWDRPTPCPHPEPCIRKMVALVDGTTASDRVDAPAPAEPSATQATTAATRNRRALMGASVSGIRWSGPAGWHPRREDISPQREGSGNHAAGRCVSAA